MNPNNQEYRMALQQMSWQRAHGSNPDPCLSAACIALRATSAPLWSALIVAANAWEGAAAADRSNKQNLGRVIMLKRSSQVALGGVVASLCILLMLMTGFFPFLTYAVLRLPVSF